MRYRHVSLYVEWTNDAEANAVRNILSGNGIKIVDTDDETDLKRTSGLSPRHENTIFHFRMNRKESVVGLMTEIAMHPHVYSVSEI